MSDPYGTQGVRQLASVPRVNFMCRAASQRIYRVDEAVCHTGVGCWKMSRPGQLQVVNPDTNRPVTACDGTMHMIERATGCQLCLLRRACVPCTEYLYRSRASSCRVLFRSFGEQLWLPVNVLGFRSCTYADTLKRIQGPLA